MFPIHRIRGGESDTGYRKITSVAVVTDKFTELEKYKSKNTLQ